MQAPTKRVLYKASGQGWRLVWFHELHPPGGHGLKDAKCVQGPRTCYQQFCDVFCGLSVVTRLDCHVTDSYNARDWRRRAIVCSPVLDQFFDLSRSELLNLFGHTTHLTQLYEISGHTVFISIIISMRLMLLNATLEYTKFRDTPILLQLSF